jgi:hypothetical protein
MKNLMKKFPLLLAFFTFSALAETTIVDNDIEYAVLLDPVDRVGHTIFLAAIGGKVTFEGDGPVNVTIRTGGQNYTALSDQTGNYSFLVYANSGRFESEAWLPGHDPVRATNGNVLALPAAAKKGL